MLPISALILTNVCECGCFYGGPVHYGLFVVTALSYCLLLYSVLQLERIERRVFMTVSLYSGVWQTSQQLTKHEGQAMFCTSKSKSPCLFLFILIQRLTLVACCGRWISGELCPSFYPLLLFFFCFFFCAVGFNPSTLSAVPCPSLLPLFLSPSCSLFASAVLLSVTGQTACCQCV